jgi:hypothetical protein
LVQLPQPAKERFEADLNLRGVSRLLSIADQDTTCPYTAQNVTTGTTVVPHQKPAMVSAQKSAQNSRKPGYIHRDIQRLLLGRLCIGVLLHEGKAVRLSEPNMSLTSVRKALSVQTHDSLTTRANGG